MTYKNVRQLLAAGDTVILDGGTGTELERRGASMNPEAWCGAATLDNRELLKAIHVDYIQAGAQVITANTYASSRLMLGPAGLADRFDDLNRAAVQTALEAREAAGVEGIAVAGSLSHMVPMVAGAAVNDLSRHPSPDELEAAFGELTALHKQEGCDLIILEMMFHPDRIPFAVNAAVETGLPVWAGMSARRGEQGEVLGFAAEVDVPFDEVVKFFTVPGVEVAGVMHTDSNTVGDALDIVRGGFEGPLMAYPDSGYFTMPTWRFEDIIPPSELTRFAADWKQRGAQVLGGCCGLSPEHICALAQSVQEPTTAHTTESPEGPNS
ncbi:MAG: homocysteine S-methyltransferase family protein [Acidimicrobiales bacterium]